MTLMRLVQSEDNNIGVIDQKFMQSPDLALSLVSAWKGYSYLPNDCDFATIKNLVGCNRFSPPIISTASLLGPEKNLFHVTVKSNDNYFSVDNQFKKITKRKKESVLTKVKNAMDSVK